MLTPQVLKFPWEEDMKLLKDNGYKQDYNEDRKWKSFRKISSRKK